MWVISFVIKQRKGEEGVNEVNKENRETYGN